MLTCYRSVRASEPPLSRFGPPSGAARPGTGALPPAYSEAGPQSEMPGTLSHSGQVHTFGVFGGRVAASMRSVHSVTSASQ